MVFRTRTLALAALLALGALPLAAQAAPAYALAGGSLVRFDTATPGAITTVGALSGATSVLDGIDFRPADGAMYGFRSSDSTIYRVDPATGITTLVSTAATPVTRNSVVGIDFNPAADRLRVVSSADDNLRIVVPTGATPGDTPLSYAVGDVNAGRNPNVIDAAYTNNDNNPATGTALYYIDNVLDILVSTTNPNGGVLNTVGALGVDADDFLGFDIYTAGGVNTAYASLRVGGLQSLYTIDLNTGAATAVGALGADMLRGLAVATVPEPATLTLVALAGLALLGRRPAARKS
jgi:Domain of unknown function (DUF4394)